MTPQRYSQVKRLFQLVLEQDIRQRQDFLAKACQGDAELYREVRALMQSDASSQEFLEKPAVTPMAKLMADSAASLEDPLPSTIGQYTVQRQIGSGGMGAVYLASRTDNTFSKQVAIKVIRKGMESDRILQRFRRERQIIASLDHPNISRLLDGGATDDGRPYIVMEFVEGQPIDTWCDQRKLPIPQRIRLFLQVCEAVHYAHQNLIIHRDIKPGNILVRPDGTVKLLDFGIAKLIGNNGNLQASDKTATSMRMMTPQYASPEQMKGDAVTTATDVYLLGVVLYELLTGFRPFETQDGENAEAVRAVTQIEPQRPSEAIFRANVSQATGKRSLKTIHAVSATRDGHPTLTRSRLLGDVDAILLKALKRTPGERYQSAAQLADDLRNHLENEPVLARPDSPAYRAGLFLKRHRNFAFTAVAALVVLAAVALYAIWQTQQAKAERTFAEKRLGEIHRVANSMLFDLQDSLAPTPGSSVARKVLIEKALDYLKQQSQESARNPLLKRDLAEGYLRAGNLLGNPEYANLGDPTAALASYQKASEILQQLLKTNGNDLQTLKALAATHEATADVHLLRNQSSPAIEALRQALQVLVKAGVPPAQHTTVELKLATALSMAGSHAEAKSLAEHALQLDGAETAKEAAMRQSLAHQKLAGVLDRAGDPAQAATHYDQAVELAQQAAAATPGNREFKRLQSQILTDSGSFERRRNSTAKAGQRYASALEIRRQVVASDPKNVQAQRDLASLFLEQGNFSDAVESFRQLAEKDPSSWLARRDLAGAWEKQGLAYRQAANTQQAAASFLELQRLAETWKREDPANEYAAEYLAISRRNLSELGR